MTKGAWLLALAAGVLGGAATGCSVEDTPHAPTFAADIRPIMLSRCVRCHGAGGHLHADKSSTIDTYQSAPFDGFFDRMEDDCPDGMVTGCHGLGFYTQGPKLMQLTDFIHDRLGAPMPPAPAPRLTDHQLGIIDTWLANGAPAE